MKKILLIARMLVAVHSVAAQQAQQPEPSERCKYLPDSPPTQIGPGSKKDPPYNFAYVSDYESNTNNYRRQICDDSTTKEGKVRFDWKLTGLKGRCPSGGTLSEETPCTASPKTGNGPLKYDLREIDSTGYKEKLSDCALPAGTLTSSLGGYVQVGDKLEPVSLKFTSAIDGSTFSYSIANLSKTPAKVNWKAFLEFWKMCQPKQYDELFSRLSQDGVLRGKADAPSVTIAAEKTAVWSFSLVGSIAKSGFSVVEVYGPEIPEKDAEADLAGVVPLYLPATVSAKGF